MPIRKIKRHLRSSFLHSVSHALPACSPVSVEDHFTEVFCDISDHLPTLYAITLKRAPKVIVECGVRDGRSTQAFIQASKHTDSIIFSVDIDSCEASGNDHPNWYFYQEDDVAFAKRLPTLLADFGQRSIDCLFIDSSHEYEHTCQEIAAFFPLLSPRATVIFHDTHLRRAGQSKNGSFLRGWDNQRGVIRAIEDYFACRFDESKPFIILKNGWLIEHVPYSHGLTVLTRCF